MCGKLQIGVCRTRGMGCYKCRRVGHVSRDCPQESGPLCFHCDQVANKKADCLMLRGRTLSAPTPATLRITDG